MGFFDPNDKQFDPSSFSYAAEQQKLALQQQLASKLMQSKVEDGKMVSGWYVAPSWKSHLASALSNIAGTYANYKIAGDGQKQLDANSIAAMQYQMNNQPKSSVEPPITPVLASTNQAPVADPASTGDVQTFPIASPESQITSTNSPLAMALGQKQFGQTPDFVRPGEIKYDPVGNPQSPTLLDKSFAPEQTPSTQRGPLSQAINASSLATDPLATAPTANPSAGASQAPMAPTSTPPSLADTLAWAQKLSNTGPLGAGISQNMIARQFPNYDVQIDKDNGKVIMVDKNNPGNIKTLDYNGGGITKGVLEKLKLAAETDKTNSDRAIAEGKAPGELKKQNSDIKKTDSDTTVTLAKAQGESLSSGQKEQGSIVAYNKAISDMSRMTELSAKVSSRYPAIASFQKLFSAKIASDPDIDELKQLFAANTMETAKAALAGSGRLGQNEYKAFQEATPSLTTNPTALANLAQRSIQTLQQQLGISKAMVGEHRRIYGNLGGNASIFDDNGLPQASGVTPGASGSVPGYKQSVTSPYSKQ